MRIQFFLLVALAHASCTKSDSRASAPVPDAGATAGTTPTVRVVSIGPRLLSNQTSQPLTITGEGLTTGMALSLGAPINQSFPLTVVDASHAYVRLPQLDLGNTSEVVVHAGVDGAQGGNDLRFAADTTFPELMAWVASPDGKSAFIVSPTEDSLYAIDLSNPAGAPQPARKIAVGDGPSALDLWTDSAKRSWVVVAHQFSEELWLVSVDGPGAETRRLPAASYASGVLVDQQSGVAYVAEQARDTVRALSLVDGGVELWRAEVDPNPRELALTTAGLAVGALATGNIELLNTSTGALVSSHQPKPGTPIIGGHTEKYSKYVMNGKAPRELTWSKKLKALFVSSIGPNIGPNPDKMEVSMNGGVGVVDVQKGWLRHLGFNAGVTEGLALDDEKGLLYASDQALGLVRVLDAKKLVQSDATAAKALLQTIEVNPPADFPHVRPDEDFSVKNRASISLHSGTKALLLSKDGKTLFTLNRFTGTVAVIDVSKASAGKATLTKQIQIVDTLGQKSRRLGQVLYFADLGKSAMSCDACHIEGHSEGILFEKTMPLRIYRSTTVRGSRETPPYFTPASTRSIGETMKVVGSRNRFHNPDLLPAEIDALTLYGSLIPTLPNPFVGADGAPRSSLELPDHQTGNPRAGQKLFEGKAACASCHPAPHYTLDQDPQTRDKFIDVGTPHFMALRPDMQNTRFEGFGIPALAGAWDVFPMLTTGLAGLEVAPDESVRVSTRFALRVAVEKWAPTHGRTDQLTEQERNDLLAFVMSL